MRTAVVVPTYNEAGNLAQLAQRLFALTPEVHVVIVDDASPDGTGELADTLAGTQPRMHVIHRVGTRGYSAASKDGLSWCLDNGFDAVASMDGDLSHDPQVLPKLIAGVTDGADLAIGSRYTEGGRLEVDWNPLRRAVSQAGSVYAGMMIGTNVRDCTSGFRCYRADSLRQTRFREIRSEGYSFLIELLAAFRDMGALTVEIPITYVDRIRGASKISGPIIREALVRTTILGIQRLFRMRRLRSSSACPPPRPR